MYRISCLIPFYNGESYDSLGEAVARQKKLESLHPHRIFDVVRDIDRASAIVVKPSTISTMNNRMVYRKTR